MLDVAFLGGERRGVFFIGFFVSPEFCSMARGPVNIVNIVALLL